MRLLFDLQEVALLEQLVQQLIELLQSYSDSSLDADPLFASLEVGGSDEISDDPALARLFPDAFEDEKSSQEFRKLTEQGLLNRKLQDAMDVVTALCLSEDGGFADESLQDNEHEQGAQDAQDAQGTTDTPTTCLPDDRRHTKHAHDDSPVQVDITIETLPSWVRTVTALRLAIAARIDLNTTEAQASLLENDETRDTVLVLNWLASIIDSILMVMRAPEAE
jgi:hypothetical protein